VPVHFEEGEPGDFDEDDEEGDEDEEGESATKYLVEGPLADEEDEEDGEDYEEQDGEGEEDEDDEIPPEEDGDAPEVPVGIDPSPVFFSFFCLFSMCQSHPYPLYSPFLPRLPPLFCVRKFSQEAKALISSRTSRKRPPCVSLGQPKSRVQSPYHFA